MNEGKLKIAAGLVPLMRWLYSAGVTSIGGATDTVMLSEDFFRESFDQYEIHERNSEMYPYELSATFDGVVFFALTERAE